MQEAQEIWGIFEARQPAWDFYASWTAFAAWVSHFGDGEAPVLKATADGRPVGLFPTRISKRRAAGISFRVLSPPRNEHWGTGYPIVGSEPEPAIRALMLGLIRRRDWDLLEFGPMLSECPLPRILISVGEEAGLAPTICHQEDNWRVRIDGTWEEYSKGRDAKFRREVARCERRLAALGEVTLEVWTSGPEFSERFAEFCDLEGRGWKGRGGTAVQCNPTVMKLHEDLMRGAAERGALRLYFLRLDGRAIACCEAIIHDGVAYGFKIGRDEAFAEYGLGNIVHKRLLKHLFRTRDAQALDYMIGAGQHGGPPRRWATEKRQYVTLRFFNPRTARGVVARNWFSVQFLSKRLAGKGRQSTG